MRASHPRRSQSALSPCRSGGQFSRRPTPSATSALLSRMTGSMNPALASASTWTDEMSRRIDSLPSRRRVRRILTPAGRRVPSRLRGASRIRRRGQGAPMHQLLGGGLEQNAINHLGYQIGMYPGIDNPTVSSPSEFCMSWQTRRLAFRGERSRPSWTNSDDRGRISWARALRGRGRNDQPRRSDPTLGYCRFGRIRNADGGASGHCSAAIPATGTPDASGRRAFSRRRASSTRPTLR